MRRACYALVEGRAPNFERTDVWGDRVGAERVIEVLLLGRGGTRGGAPGAALSGPEKV